MYVFVCSCAFCFNWARPALRCLSIAGISESTECVASQLTSLYVRRTGVTMKKRVKIKRIVSASC